MKYPGLSCMPVDSLILMARQKDKEVKFAVGIAMKR